VFLFCGKKDEGALNVRKYNPRYRSSRTNEMLGELLEVGELFAFLESDEASSFIGRQIVIDVGSTLLESMSMGTRKNLNLKKLEEPIVESMIITTKNELK